MRRMASQPPELDGFHFIRLLGSGGFSDVFLYEQQLPKRSVAVKVLLTDGVDESARARFVAEANVMARLSAHPYIVTIFHAGVAGDDRPFLVMEYCSGPSLADRLKRERIGVEDALRTGVRLSSAVATAHAAGILHRDIKPANVLTNALGWPALTDFGIASALEELPVHTTTLSELRSSPSDTATSGSRSVGLSVPWSPPEMFSDDPDPDVRSDIFSLAATVHTLLAGRTPFEVPGRSNGTLDLMGRIERGMITPLDRPDVPASLAAVLRRGMATRREDRYQTAVDFARALQRVELELGLAPTSIDVPNLSVGDARPGPSADGGEQETRARSVATIRAQQPAPAPSTVDARSAERPPAPATPAAPEPEATRVRGVVPISAQPPARSATTDDKPSAEPVQDHTILRSRPSSEEGDGTAQSGADDASDPDASTGPRDPRRRLLTWIGVGAAAVVVLAVAAAVVANLVAAPSTSTGPGAQPSDGGSIAVTVVPPPVLVSAVRAPDGASATFTWKTADAQKDDQFTWQQEGTTNGPSVTAERKVTLTNLTPGVPVCIDVATVRAGRTSEQLKACAP
ncbi:Serine/threonine protein kinase [Leifsonia sp. 98AMF]|nr:Serine/threonine protein kinase [Leifsonia sp. 197AMF]SDJ07982.1 Serine/threonine protein kinase [Leifsonia sp. 466MF]SDJ63157.1 Serine/threonine protein kinase [Leifsonia sp. 157MF]SDN28974.1 Serine/threonine protein kinase [Leifsonia sp. 509MF]SEM92085.1 Serine/threonine protein kinase [Leifsonia sp. 467MF]SFM31818.1 Serine/threonine protein kinase [Leifsonia sp. 98AMF]